VHKRNRSLQKVICKTVVVYDWLPEAEDPGVLANPSHPAGSGQKAEAGRPVASVSSP